MRDAYEQLFKSLRSLEPPEALLAKILIRIAREQRRSARIRVAFVGSAALLSGALLVPAFQYAAQEWYESGFYQYLSLLFSDGGAALASWQEFSQSLAESLPVSGITFVLMSVFALLISLKFAAKNMKNALSPIHFINP